ncbi:MAG: 23S rRNA (guanosine(2251)-2'-O)-methyltransferase RlmB [Acetobacterales bacterium]
MDRRKGNDGGKRRGVGHRPGGGPSRQHGSEPGANRTAGESGGGIYWLFGLHSAEAALRNPLRRIHRVLCIEQHREKAAAAIAAGEPVPVEIIGRADIDGRLPPGSVHQGLALRVSPLPELMLDDALSGAGAAPRVVVLDQVTDPHNVGAILRSAAAFGACAVVVQRRHSPPETAALAKAASGGLERVPLVRETNLARAIVDLQERGFWCIGLDPDAPRTLAEAVSAGPTALVLGAEGPGLRRLTAERCDALARLPITGVESLNVAAAAAIGLYELNRDRA